MKNNMIQSNIFFECGVSEAFSPKVSLKINHFPNKFLPVNEFCPTNTTLFLSAVNFFRNGASNSIIVSAWQNQTYSFILCYWLIVCGYEMSVNRRAVSLSALTSFQYTTTVNYTIARVLS